MRQPAWDRKLFAGLVGARIAAAKSEKLHILPQPARERKAGF